MSGTRKKFFGMYIACMSLGCWSCASPNSQDASAAINETSLPDVPNMNGTLENKRTDSPSISSTSRGDRANVSVRVSVDGQRHEVDTIQGELSLFAVADSAAPEQQPQLTGGVNIYGLDIAFRILIPNDVAHLEGLRVEVGQDTTRSFLTLDRPNGPGFISTMGSARIVRASKAEIELEISDTLLSELGGSTVSSMSGTLVGPPKLACFVSTGSSPHSEAGDQPSGGVDDAAMAQSLVPDATGANPICARLSQLL